MCLITETLPPHTHLVKDPFVLVCILERGQAEKGRVTSADRSVLSIATPGKLPRLCQWPYFPSCSSICWVCAAAVIHGHVPEVLKPWDAFREAGIHNPQMREQNSRQQWGEIRRKRFDLHELCVFEAWTKCLETWVPRDLHVLLAISNIWPLMKSTKESHEFKSLYSLRSLKPTRWRKREWGGQRFEVGGWGVTRRDLQRLENWENRGKTQKELDPRPGLHAGALRGVQPGFPGVIKAGKHLFLSFIFFLRCISFVPRCTRLERVPFPPRWSCSGGHFRDIRWAWHARGADPTRCVAVLFICRVSLSRGSKG